MLKCNLSNLRGLDVKEKKRSWFSKKCYLRCMFLIIAEIGPAEVDFYACSRDGLMRLSQPNRIQLNFEEIPIEGDETVLVNRRSN